MTSTVESVSEPASASRAAFCLSRRGTCQAAVYASSERQTSAACDQRSS